MALTAFSSRLGISQGRLPSKNAPDGSHVFVLGDLEPGHFAELAPGDYVEVSQATDLTGVALVRVWVQLRVPDEVPPGLAWEVSLVVGGTKRASARGRPGRARELTDLAANTSKMSGMHTVAVRLGLVTR